MRLGFFKALNWIKQKTKYPALASVLTFIVSLCGACFFLDQVGQSYRVSDWLLWPILQVVLYSACLFFAFVVAGHAILRRLVSLHDVPTCERMLQSMVLGFGIFAALMYAAGALHWYGATFAVGMPLLMVAGGVRDLPIWLKETRERFQSQKRSSLWVTLASGCVVAWAGYMLAMLYLTSLTPDSFNFDAMWYHVPIAQDYARAGGIVPFYGDNHRAYPHLASFLHTWALLVPGIKQLPVRWMLMLHLEFACVLWRIVGVAAVARWLLNGRAVKGLWAVFFLFPSVFIYDQNVAGSADHVLGMTAAPVFLAVARMMKNFDVRWSFVAGVAAGCHILTKYQAIYLVSATTVVVLLRFCWLLGVKRFGRGSTLNYRQIFAAPAALLGVALVVSSPHFIKNAIYYQNPFYPFASRLFPSSFDEWTPPAEAHSALGDQRALEFDQSPARPPNQHGLAGADHPNESVAFGVLGHTALANVGAHGFLALVGASEGARAKLKVAQSAASSLEETSNRFRYRARAYSFSPQGRTILERLVWAQRTFFDWSFKVGNRQLTKGRPYMGSLFTLLLPLLVFLRPAKRLRFGFAFIYLAFLTWALTNANDRYLLTFLTLPIGLTAALLARGWALGGLSRVGLSCLLAAQLAWGGDAPLVYAGGRLKDTISLIDRGYRGGDLDRRFPYFRSGLRLTEAFPKDALILGRYFKANLGFDRAMLNTHAPVQSYVNFRKVGNPREFWQLCKDRGITHLLYPEGKRKPTSVQDIIMIDALADVSEDHKKVDGNVIVRLAQHPPQNKEAFMVLVQGTTPYQDGLHPVQKLSYEEHSKEKVRVVKTNKKLTSKTASRLLSEADAVYMTHSTIQGDTQHILREEFKMVERFGRVTVWLRKKSRHATPPAN